MAEPPSIKVQIDYKDPDNVEAEVPGSQQLREVDPNERDVTSDGQGFTLEPVITVTKKESTFTKGDLKLQKVTVTEDISVSEIQNGGRTLSKQSYQATMHSAVKDGKTHDEKKSKIPMLKFRQAAERVKKHRKTREAEQPEKHPRRSSIPRLKKETKPAKTITPPAEPEDEFEKIYGEIVDDKQEDIDDKILGVKIEDPDKLESKFEEIMHAYEEDADDVQHVEVEKVQLRERQTRIPALKRRKADSGAANLSAIVDNIRLKNAVRKSQEFSNEEVTEGFTRITTRRIYSERSREVTSVEKIGPKDKTSNESKTEHIDITKEAISREPRKSKLDALRRKYTTDATSSNTKNVLHEHKIEGHESKITIDNHISENKSTNIQVSDPIELNKNEENLLVSMTESEEAKLIEDSKETPIKGLKREISQEITRNAEIKSNYSRNGSTVEVINTEGVKQVLTTARCDFKTDLVTHISTDNEAFTTKSNIEYVNTQNDEIAKTIDNSATAKTIVANSVVNEQTDNKEITNTTNITLSTDDKNKNLNIKQTIITKQISPECATESNIIEYTDTRTNNYNNEGRQVIKTEQIIKESIKIGVPTFTKVTNTCSEENVQHVEIDKSLEWKPLETTGENLIVTKITNNDKEKSEIEFIKGYESNTDDTLQNKLQSLGKYKVENAEQSITDKQLVDKDENVTDNVLKKEHTNENSDTHDTDELEPTVLRGNVSRLINRLSFREPAPNRLKKTGDPELDTEHVERVRRIDKMILNFGKLDQHSSAGKTEYKDLTNDTRDNLKTHDLQSFKNVIREMSRNDENQSKVLTIPRGNVSRLISNIGSLEKTTVNANEDIVTDSDVNEKIVTERSKNLNDFKTTTPFVEAKNISDPKLVIKVSSNILESNNKTALIDTNFKHDKDNTDDTKECIHINIEEKKANYTIENGGAPAERVITKERVFRSYNKAGTEEVQTKETMEVKEELPKRKSVLSKVAIFESLEGKETYPRGKFTQSDTTISKLVSKDTVIDEKPRIVDEVLKRNATSQKDVNYIDTAKSGSKTVSEIWLTSLNEVDKVQNISLVGDVKEIKFKTYNLGNEASLLNADIAELKPKNVDSSKTYNINENTQISTVITKQTTATGNGEDIQANIYFVPKDNNDENSITATDNDVHSAVLTVINNRNDQYNNVNNSDNDISNKYISEVKTNTDSTLIQNKDQNYVTTVIGNIITNTFTSTEGQSTENDAVLKKNVTTAVENKVYSIKDKFEDASMENSTEIYERVRTKCTNYERNVSTISRELSRTESKEYSKYTELTGSEFNVDFALKNNKIYAADVLEDEFRRKDLRHSKSVVEADLGDAVKGTVSRLVGRLKSVDFDRTADVKVEKINIKERPPRSSVLEKIALFEGKLTASRMHKSTESRIKVAKKSTPQVITEEEYLKKIAELSSVRSRFQKTEGIPNVTLNNGVEMPIMALGTALLDKRLIPHIIGAAIDLGYRSFDCAYIYGNEKEVGGAIQAKIEDGTVRREDLFIISKLWSTFHRPDLVEVACRSSLDAMGLTYFDLYVIHNPMSFKEGGEPVPKIATVLQYSQYNYLDAWFGMEDLLNKGLVRSIGVSNFNSVQLQRILDKGKVIPVVNQVECHPYLSQERLHNFCIERNVALSCYGVLGSKGTPDEYKSSLPAAIDDPLVLVMASGLNVTASQLLIRYQIQQNRSVVVKSSSAEHLWDNLQALTFSLTEAQIQALQALNRNKRTFAFIGMGDTHKNYPFLAAF